MRKKDSFIDITNQQQPHWPEILGITPIHELRMQGVPLDIESRTGKEIIHKLAAMQSANQGFILLADPEVKRAVDTQALCNVANLGFGC